MTEKVEFRAGRGKFAKFCGCWGHFYICFTYCVNDTHFFVTAAGALIRLPATKYIFTPEKINVYENKKFNFQTTFIQSLLL